LLIVNFASTPFAYHRPVLPGRDGRKSSPWDVGWSQYCDTCEHIGFRNISEIPGGAPCSKNHLDTEVLITYICQQCGQELLFRKRAAPRQAKKISCQAGVHTPTPALVRAAGTDSDVKFLVI
jgi:hypothetical protein